ncbi:hypothetical protein CPB85DRAFT_1406003 [Mucidula mucida]|nr:hypothetical protein CPB85DRAFT_1406003 [Mucidula mucida]
MSEKRKADGGDKKNNKKRYRSDGTPIWGKRHIDGPGVWVSCVKGREKQAVGELYDLFESLGSELWPPEHLDGLDESTDDDDATNGLSIEEQISREVSAIKTPKREQRFSNCQTNTTCVIFMSCKRPVDPVKLVETHIANVQRTGITRTRYCHRFVPVSGSCVTNLPEIQSLCRPILGEFFSRDPNRKYTYKIEMRTRNHTVLPRDTLIKSIAECVPEGHTVNLSNPEVFILVEVFKSVFGISVTKEYYNLLKYNVVEIANRHGKAAGTTNASEAKSGDKEASVD